jgi:hypothetical protein
MLCGTPDEGPRTETCYVLSTHYILNVICAELNLLCCLFDYIRTAGWMVLKNSMQACSLSC